MNLRRSKDEASAPVEEVVLEKVGGKNRPTPTRKEAQASRPVQPYVRTKATTSARTTSTKGLKGADKKAARQANKAAQRQQFERQRAALKAGDQANLPARDKGPERAFVRDLVDARSGGVLQLAPAVAIIAFIADFIPGQAQYLATTLMLAVFTAAIGDGVILTRRIGKRVQAKFPGTGVRVKMYAVQRAVLPRRFRLPPPRVDRGQEIA